MNLGSLVADKRKVCNIKKHTLNTLDSAKGIFCVSKDLFSDFDHTFYINLINVFDRAVINKNLHLLSVEQERLLENYFKEAVKMEDDRSKSVTQLDAFLGSYRGKDADVYAYIRNDYE